MPQVTEHALLDPAPVNIRRGLPEYLPWLDVLRFLACFLVIVLHCVPRAPAALGHAGVALFFSISGFLIGRILIRDPGLLSFYSRRWLRIYPAYLATLLVTAGLFLTHVGGKAAPAQAAQIGQAFGLHAGHAAG